jgi:hypothetical protein
LIDLRDSRPDERRHSRTDYFDAFRGEWVPVCREDWSAVLPIVDSWDAMARPTEHQEVVTVPPLGRALPPVVRRFPDTEASGGVVLVAAAVVALVWANSPWDGTYDRLWENEVA